MDWYEDLPSHADARRGASHAACVAALCAPGQILHVGGGGNTTTVTSDGRRAADVIDINGAMPAVPPLRAR